MQGPQPPVLQVLGGLPGTSGPPLYSGAAQLASRVNMDLEFPLTALGAPVTTYPEAQVRAPGCAGPGTGMPSLLWLDGATICLRHPRVFRRQAAGWLWHSTSPTLTLGAGGPHRSSTT